MKKFSDFLTEAAKSTAGDEAKKERFISRWIRLLW